MDAFEILVIVLSVILALFLITSLIAVIYLVKIVKNIKKISDKAASLVESASATAFMMKKAAQPAVVAKFVAEQISNAVSKHNDKSKKEK
jgi:1,4-dihydroxy-2-naphthoate octaprenyltransferase